MRSPANRCHVQAAGDGASLAFDPEPGRKLADEMHEIAPPAPRSPTSNGPRWLFVGSAQGFGVATPAPCWRIRHSKIMARPSRFAALWARPCRSPSRPSESERPRKSLLSLDRFDEIGIRN